MKKGGRGGARGLRARLGKGKGNPKIPEIGCLLESPGWTWRWEEESQGRCQAGPSVSAIEERERKGAELLLGQGENGPR